MTEATDDWDDPFDGTLYEVCRVYWGSHGCDLPRGHDPAIPHMCLSCLPGYGEDMGGYVGMPPYYGTDTRFYGEDAVVLGLPLA